MGAVPNLDAPRRCHRAPARRHARSPDAQRGPSTRTIAHRALDRGHEPQPQVEVLHRRLGVHGGGRAWHGWHPSAAFDHMRAFPPARVPTMQCPPRRRHRRPPGGGAVPETERSHHHPCAARHRGRPVAVETRCFGCLTEGDPTSGASSNRGRRDAAAKNAHLAFCLLPALPERDRVRTGQHLDVSAATAIARPTRRRVTA